MSPRIIALMARSRFTRVFLPILATAVFILGAMWAAWAQLDTSKMACDPEVPIDSARLALWNPLRDRGPERAATLVMKAIESGGCQSISGVQNYCSERKPVAAWKVTGRIRGKNEIFVRIWVTARVHDGSFGDNALYVKVQKVRTNWVVTGADWSDPC